MYVQAEHHHILINHAAQTQVYTPRKFLSPFTLSYLFRHCTPTHKLLLIFKIHKNTFLYCPSPLNSRTPHLFLQFCYLWPWLCCHSSYHSDTIEPKHPLSMIQHHQQSNSNNIKKTPNSIQQSRLYTHMSLSLNHHKTTKPRTLPYIHSDYIHAATYARTHINFHTLKSYIYTHTSRNKHKQSHLICITQNHHSPLFFLLL